MEKRAQNGEIDPLENLKNSPVLITTGGIDPVIFPELTESQKYFYQSVGADFKMTLWPDRAHKMGWNDTPDLGLQYLYENLPDSGITADKPL